MLARQIRFTCPHCGAVNRAPVRSIGRGGTCLRCGGGVKIPSAHAVGDAIIEDDHQPAVAEIFDLTSTADLIDAGLDRSFDEDGEVPLFDLGRPTHPTRSVTAPSAVVAEATLLPTAAQLANSDRVERSVLPPVQAIRSLRRFSRNGRPQRHVAARRQQPGTPWWAWLAHGTLTIGAMYVLASIYNGNFNAQVVAFPSTPALRTLAAEDDADSATTQPTAEELVGQLGTASITASTSESELAALISGESPDERTWIRYERILLANKKQQYAVVRITQARDGRVRVDRNETSERPADFPEDATLIDRRGTAGTPSSPSPLTPAADAPVDIR